MDKNRKDLETSLKILCILLILYGYNIKNKILERSVSQSIY